MTIAKITGLAISGDTALDLVWEDGRHGHVDLSTIVAARAALRPLADADAFAGGAMSADGWSIEWPCGIDFGTAQLRRWSDEQAGEAMPTAAFRDWVERHKLTLDGAARALGVSRRTIAYYLSGEQPIPKMVMLATEGYDSRAAA